MYFYLIIDSNHAANTWEYFSDERGQLYIYQYQREIQFFRFAETKLFTTDVYVKHINIKSFNYHQV